MKTLELDPLLRKKTLFLANSNIDSPRLSAEVLLAFTLTIDRQELLKRLILRPNTQLTEAQIDRYESLILRRSQGEPVAYITGVKEFYGYSFTVTPDTLIPRPETEILIEKAVEIIQTYSKEVRFADLGAGSGCIGIALALQTAHVKGILLEKSKPALEVAKLNIQRLHACNISPVLGDFTSPPLALSSFDIIISNPPYVSTKEYEEVSKEVSGYEPHTALVPECNSSHGLEHLKKIADIAKDHLTAGGWLLMEMGYTQGSAMSEYLYTHGWNNISVVKDLANLDRIIIGQYT